MEERFGAIDFIHPVLNKAVRTISGRYILTQEKRLSYDDGEVLYFLGCAAVDSSCCGPGGCSYALVPGYIKDWKYKATDGGLAVSRVQPIRNEDEQSEIRWQIMQKEPTQQVDFLT